MADAEATIEAEEDEGLAEPAAAEPAQEQEPAAQEQPAPEKKKEKKKGGKDKKGDKRAEGRELADAPSVAGHPRAARSIERAKGWAALVGLTGGFYLSLPTHTLAEAGLRALIAGVVLYVAVWAGGVFFWRRMVMVEIRAREQQLIAAARAAHARAAAAADGSQGAGR